MSLLNSLAGHVVFPCSAIRKHMQDDIHCRYRPVNRPFTASLSRGTNDRRTGELETH